MTDFARASDVVQRGIEDRAFPAAVVEVGTGRAALWHQAFGTLDYDQDSTPAQINTIFDLASLTKVIATTTLVMQLVERGALALHDPIGKWIPEWRGRDREDVTLRSLLTHSSGLTAWLPFYRDHAGRQEFRTRFVAALSTLTIHRRSIATSVLLLGSSSRCGGLRSGSRACSCETLTRPLMESRCWTAAVYAPMSTTVAGSRLIGRSTTRTLALGGAAVAGRLAGAGGGRFAQLYAGGIRTVIAAGSADTVVL